MSRDKVLAHRAQLAQDTIDLQPTAGIPSWMVHTMDIGFIEEYMHLPPGSFKKDCHRVYCDFQEACGVCMIDQYLADNPLSMEQEGFASDAPRSATTGAERIERDGIIIDSPESVVEHMERVAFADLARRTREIQADPRGQGDKILDDERFLQNLLGPNILKVPYAQAIPYFDYSGYGYENYFGAYGLYPEVIERAYSLQADYAVAYNSAVAGAIVRGGRPRLVRIDHDMADSRGPLTSMSSLERMYYPHLERALKPFLDAGIRCIHHCDGNMMPMLGPLLAVGIGGFQGFQYEDGMDYVSICRMKDRTGGPLVIIAGVSSATTLPRGRRQDVIDQLNWLVANGPRVGLFLGASSSIVPNTNRDNIRTLIEGLKHYQSARGPFG